MSSLGSFEELINNNNAELKEFQIEIEKEYKGKKIITAENRRN